MDLLLRALSYSKYGWKIFGDLKVIGFLLGLQSGYMKLCCFLCEWDSREQDQHYKIMDWSLLETSFQGEKYVRYRPLFEKDKILLPSLHINSLALEMDI